MIGDSIKMSKDAENGCRPFERMGRAGVLFMLHKVFVALQKYEGGII